MKLGGFKRRRPITKMALFLRAMRIALWLTIVFGVLMLIMAIFGGDEVQLQQQDILRFVINSTIAFFIIMILTLSPVILFELNWIKRQEKHFGISFNEEMKKYDVKGYVHMDENWLILVSGCRIYAYRKGFLTNFGIQRRSFLGKKMGSKVMAACADGKARMIVGTGATLTAIANWAYEIEESEKQKNTEENE